MANIFDMITQAAQAAQRMQNSQNQSSQNEPVFNDKLVLEQPSTKWQQANGQQTTPQIDQQEPKKQEEMNAAPDESRNEKLDKRNKERISPVINALQAYKSAFYDPANGRIMQNPNETVSPFVEALANNYLPDETKSYSENGSSLVDENGKSVGGTNLENFVQQGDTGADEESSSKNSNTKGKLVGQEANGDTSVASSAMSDDEFQKLFGLSRADYDKLEQRDQFQKALESEALKQYYQDTYGIGGEFGYEQWRDLGNTYDYSGKHDLVRDVLGLGEDPSMAIPGWNALYGSTGINMDRGENNANDEAIIQAVMDYMWSPENIINMGDWVADSQVYGKQHNLGAEGAADMIAQYYLNNNALDGEVTKNILQNFTDQSGNPYDIDNKDIAAWIMAQNLANKDASYFNNWGDANLDQISAILAGAGDTANLRFAGDDEEASQWNPSNVPIAQILSAAQGGNDLSNLIYSGEGVNDPIFANVIDSLASTIEKNTNKKIKSSNKD